MYKRQWKKCVCPIYASGTLAGKFKRRNTETTGWDQAKAVVSNWQTAQSWDSSAVATLMRPPAVIETSPMAPARIRIDDAMKAYISLREASKMAPSTLRKYRTFAKQLTEFAEGRGYVMIDQFTACLLYTSRCV